MTATLIAKIIVGLLLSMFATFAHDTHATSHRCRHEARHGATYVQCESRTGDLVTYTFTKIVTVKV